MMTKPAQSTETAEEVYLGYRIHKLEGVYIAVPLAWAGDRGETIAACDLPTLRKEIRRWWYLLGA